MDHVAIMKKSWGLLPMILSGEKKIESRWYLNKYKPWDKIKKGETVYFKNTGGSVSLKAKVKKVLQFSDLNQKKVRSLLNNYGKDDGISKDNIGKFYEMFKDKKYCILVFLESPKELKPFNINKKGFGLMSAWISLPDINGIKIILPEC